MDVVLVDGTYELFRHYFAVPSRVNDRGEEIGAVRGVAGSLLALLEQGATHVGVATDHVIESFRNELYPPYKDGSGVEAALLDQFPILEEVLGALGFVVWAMVDHEADDALAAAAAAGAADDRVDRVLVATPDKDLAQCVVAGRVWQWDRRKDVLVGPDEVLAKFGVEPASIPDWLALVGDTADGFPGLPGWGAKSAAAVLRKYHHLDAVPDDAAEWHVDARGAGKLAATLRARRDEALLYRRLATLVDDCVEVDVDALRWTGPADDAALDELAARLDDGRLPGRVRRLAADRRA
jgi:5'-3' exonuclease